MDNERLQSLNPSSLYVNLSYFAFLFSICVFGIGLFNAEMLLSEKGFYIIAIIFGFYSVITLQKALRDKMEGYDVNESYMKLSYFGVATPIILMAIGLWNAELQLNEKGFFAVTFIMTLFSSIVVQKNIRDKKLFESENPQNQPERTKRKLFDPKDEKEKD